MSLTADELRRIMPYSGKRADLFAQPLSDAMQEFDICNTGRECAFLAQVAHESGELRYVKELSSGEQYEGRADLGNTEPGDGVRFKGRGLIQITGRANYRDCGDALGLDLVERPDLLEQPDHAARSAAWFWHKHGLNQIADTGGFELITRRINGGLNGYADRLAYLRRAQQTLGDVA